MNFAWNLTSYFKRTGLSFVGPTIVTLSTELSFWNVKVQNIEKQLVDCVTFQQILIKKMANNDKSNSSDVTFLWQAKVSFDDSDRCVE